MFDDFEVSLVSFFFLLSFVYTILFLLGFSFDFWDVGVEVC